MHRGGQPEVWDGGAGAGLSWTWLNLGQKLKAVILRFGILYSTIMAKKKKPFGDKTTSLATK